MEALPFHTLTRESAFYFIRHGESDANARGVVQGTSESSLSARGRKQAAAAGKWCARRGIDRIYSSPLGRAQETARIIGRHCKQEYQVHELAHEIDTGVFSNKTWHEVVAEYPQEYREFRVKSWEAVPEAERIANLLARARRYWQHLIDEANSGACNIATVSHGGIMQWLLKASMGMRTEWMPLIPIRNCAICMLYVRPEAYAEKESADQVRGAYHAWQHINLVPY